MVIKLFSLSRLLLQKAIVFIADEWQLQNHQWQRKKYYKIVKRCHGYKAFFFVTDTSTKIYSVYQCLSQNCQWQRKSIITLWRDVKVIKLFSLSRMLLQKAIVFIADEWQLQNRQWQRKKYYNIVKRCHGYKAFFFVTGTSTKIYSVYRCLSQHCQCQKKVLCAYHRILSDKEKTIITFLISVNGYKVFSLSLTLLHYSVYCR